MIRGRVVLVPFPFDDPAATKVRPAVCLTEPVGPHRHVILAFITSRIPDDMQDSDLVLDSRDAEFPATGLRVPSAIRLHRILTAATGIIQRDLGFLSHRTQAGIGQKLRRPFGV